MSLPIEEVVPVLMDPFDFNDLSEDADERLDPWELVLDLSLLVAPISLNKCGYMRVIY